MIPVMGHGRDGFPYFIVFMDIVKVILLGLHTNKTHHQDLYCEVSGARMLT